MRAINRVEIPYVEVSRLTTMHICTYTITWRERGALSPISAPLLRASRRNRAYVWPWMRTRRITARQGGKKVIVIPIPTILFTEFLSFHQASESMGPIFRRPHLSRLVAGKIRRWPATSRRVVDQGIEGIKLEAHQKSSQLSVSGLIAMIDVGKIRNNYARFMNFKRTFVFSCDRCVR